MSLIDLSGKAALVTGGSRGVGAATAVMLARAGASVAITYKARKSAAEDVLGRIADVWDAGGGPPARPPARPSISVQADVSRREDNERAVDEARAAFGRLDIFVANAGIWPPDDVAVRDMDDTRWRDTLGVNLDSVFYGCRAAMNAMERGGRGEGGGRIVIVTARQTRVRTRQSPGVDETTGDQCAVGIGGAAVRGTVEVADEDDGHRCRDRPEMDEHVGSFDRLDKSDALIRIEPSQSTDFTLRQ